ncbi:MAG: flagellar basal-body rod protein FlgF [Alphaproteobacteria bacterium]|nr:flagellar basal-body rod protein FlgF [Alphaproteobacteria bacterium]
MENATYIGLSRQMAMRRQMDVIANNLANMNTAGFRSEQMLFEEHLMRLAGREQAKASFVLDWGTLRSLRDGAIETTGNPLDVAISGRGFLVVETPEGRRYTRNGHLRLSDQGELTTRDGHAVLDDRNAPIRLERADGRITIAPDGSVSNANGLVARLNLVRFENEQQMRKAGDNLYSSDEPELPAEGAQFVQGAIEGSNVEPIVEMTNMVELHRSYQAMQRVLEADQEIQRRAIERLGKIA